jgi:hypothetical protein
LDAISPCDSAAAELKLQCAKHVKTENVAVPGKRESGGDGYYIDGGGRSAAVST